jgi:hypothetical protein
MRHRLWLVLCAALAAGCASGPKFSEVRSTIPDLAPEHGRIFFYRPSAVGAAVQPNILLNGDVVGEMVPLGFFFVDRYPGNYVVSAATESEASVSLSLEPKQTQYVRGSLSIGFFVGRPVFTLVDQTSALAEMEELSYVGSTPLTGDPARAAAPPGAAPPPPAPAKGSATTLKDLEGLMPGAAGSK